MTTLAQPATVPKPAQDRRGDAPRPEPPAPERRAQSDEKAAPPIVRAAPHPRPAQPETYKFDVHQYHAMAKAGILHPDDRVELIDGEIIAMSGIGPEHAATVNVGAELLFAGVRRRAMVSVQNPIELNDRNRPEPDIALLRRRDDFYWSRMPGADDMLLIIEVANTSLRFDRRVKLELYARFGVPETWIANIQDRTIEVYSDPVNGEYTEKRTFRQGQTVTPSAFPDIALPVSDVIRGLPESAG